MIPTTKQLSQAWPVVRNLLFRACGIPHTSQSDHCFADATHMECCSPPPSQMNNTNANGLAPGISRTNRLPFTSHQGKWCTCQSGQVCQNQFHQTPKWTAIWIGTHIALVRHNTILVSGRPTGRLPSATVRKQSFEQYVRHHPAMKDTIKAWRTQFKSKPKSHPLPSPAQRSSRTRRTTHQNASPRYPLCSTLPDELNKQTASFRRPRYCRCAHSTRLMPYPRLYSRKQCRAFQHPLKGFTKISSCAAYTC